MGDRAVQRAGRFSIARASGAEVGSSCSSDMILTVRSTS